MKINIKIFLENKTFEREKIKLDVHRKTWGNKLFKQGSSKINKLHEICAVLHFLFKQYPEESGEKVKKMLNYLFIVRKLKYYQNPSLFGKSESSFMRFFKFNMDANYYFLVENVTMKTNDTEFHLIITVKKNLKNLPVHEKSFLIANLITSYTLFFEHLFQHAKNNELCCTIENNFDQFHIYSDRQVQNFVALFHNSVKISRNVNQCLPILNSSSFQGIVKFPHLLFKSQSQVNIDFNNF